MCGCVEMNMRSKSNSIETRVLVHIFGAKCKDPCLTYELFDLVSPRKKPALLNWPLQPCDMKVVCRVQCTDDDGVVCNRFAS